MGGNGGKRSRAHGGQALALQDTDDYGLLGAVCTGRGKGGIETFGGRFGSAQRRRRPPLQFRKLTRVRWWARLRAMCGEGHGEPCGLLLRPARERRRRQRRLGDVAGELRARACPKMLFCETKPISFRDGVWQLLQHAGRKICASKAHFNLRDDACEKTRVFEVSITALAPVIFVAGFLGLHVGGIPCKSVQSAGGRFWRGNYYESIRS
jgi:hypothetical protein